MTPTDKYKHMNHYHELTSEHEIVDFGEGEFIANKEGIPLLKSLNDIGLKTRTHHINKNGGFVSIILDNTQIEIKKVNEIDSTRTRYNGKYELLIKWDR